MKNLGTIEPRTNDYIDSLTEYGAKDLLCFINGVLLKYNDDEYSPAIVRYIRRQLHTNETIVKETIKNKDWVYPTTEIGTKKKNVIEVDVDNFKVNNEWFNFPYSHLVNHFKYKSGTVTFQVNNEIALNKLRILHKIYCCMPVTHRTKKEDIVFDLYLKQNNKTYNFLNCFVKDVNDSNVIITFEYSPSPILN